MTYSHFDPAGQNQAQSSFGTNTGPNRLPNKKWFQAFRFILGMSLPIAETVLEKRQFGAQNKGAGHWHMGQVADPN